MFVFVVTFVLISKQEGRKEGNALLTRLPNSPPPSIIALKMSIIALKMSIIALKMFRYSYTLIQTNYNIISHHDNTKYYYFFILTIT